MLTQSSFSGASQKNLYSNVVYACKWCNRSRGVRALVDAEGRTLQDPTREVWQDLFVIHDDALVPAGDASPDATYTWETYELGDPLKTELRRKRRKELAKARRHLKQCPGYIKRIETQIAAGGHSVEALAELREELTLHAELLADTQAVLAKRRAVPKDHDASCACPRTASLDLPAPLKAQLSSSE